MKLRTFAHFTLPVWLLAGVLLLAPPGADGKTGDKNKKNEKSESAEKGGGARLLRRPTGVKENVRNRVSSVDFYNSNYGIFGNNIAAGRAGGFWPRGSSNAYIFGGGIWFGARKIVNDTLRKMCVISYDPNSGASWMVPGRIDTTIPLNRGSQDESPAGITKNRVYFSTDYNSFTGEPLDPTDNGPNWPIWDVFPGDTLKRERYVGVYVDEIDLRNRETFPKGPAFISGEDVFSTFKDTDLNFYAIGRGLAEAQGYPLGLQVEQTIFSWGTGLYKDFIFIRYYVINRSKDTLYNCFMAPAMDMDIGGAGNDRNKIAIPVKSDDSLNLAIQWSDAEATRYGYIGFDFLESPAIDKDEFVRNGRFRDTVVRTSTGVRDSLVFPKQIGLTTFRNWILENDPKTPEERYDFMASGLRDEDTGPGDKRFLMSTGGFNLRPGDTARVVVGVLFANAVDTTRPASDPGHFVQPTGRWPDTHDLIELDKFAQKVYDDNFLAPKPPDPANVSWKPLDNGVELRWDETSERSLDVVEGGLDFYGYNLQRSRKAAGGFTQTDSITGYNIGWKTIVSWVMPKIPDSTTRFLAGRTGNLSLLGSWSRLPMLADSFPGLPFLNPKKSVQYRVDTIKRPGLPDSLKLTKVDSIFTFNFAFDPYDDKNNDSTVFNNTKYGNDPRFRNKAIKTVVRDAIVAIMDSITRGHRYVDIGDDNRDGTVEENQSNLTLNEKMINNIDYYYRLLSFDEGDPTQGTTEKLSASIVGINEIRATPEAPAAGFPLAPTVVSEHGLGGISNFRFISFDDERLGQLFGGDTLVFTFQPTDLKSLQIVSGNTISIPSPNRWYNNEVVVTSKRTGFELMRFFVDYDNLFTDRADSLFPNLVSLTPDRKMLVFTTRTYYFPRDTVINGIDTTVTDTVFYDARNVKAAYTGSFFPTPDNPILGTTAIYKETFGASFDYRFLQFGDSLRFDTAGGRKGVALTAGDANTNLLGIRQFVGTYAADANNRLIYSPIPSVGQAKIEVEFLPGGNETIQFTGKDGKNYTFPNVPFLTVKVRNVATFARERIDENGQTIVDSVRYDYEFPLDPQAQLKGDTSSSTSLPKTINLGHYGLFAYGWLDATNVPYATRRSAVNRGKYIANDTALGTAGRYYVGVAQGVETGTGNPHTLTFSHRLLVNGADIVLDFAGFGSTERTVKVENVPQDQPTVDFEAGDKFVANFTGGTAGLPQPGARVEVAIPNPKPALGEYTDNLLDQIHVVPNPYLIDHLGQIAPSDRKLYFTRLPEQCKIEIFTAAGELIRTIDHVSSEANGRVAVDAWDMITLGSRQAQSQLLIARITTPNGAEVIKKFAVIVGGFRLVTQ